MTIGHLDLRPPANPLPGGSDGDASGILPLLTAGVTPTSEARRELLADIAAGCWDIDDEGDR